MKQLPAASELIEMAHVLPAKAGHHKPIIARFHSCFYCSICLRLKKDFAPKKPASSSGRFEYCFPFYEDLTRSNFT